MRSLGANQFIAYIKPRVLFVILVLVVLATIMSNQFSRDSIGYHTLIRYYAELSLPFWQTFNQQQEALFIWLSLLSTDSYTGHLFVFLVYALLSISIKVYLIDKKSRFYWLSLGFYICYFFLFQDGTAIRVSLAIGLLFLSLLLLENDKSLLFVLSVLLVSFLLHYSALLFLVMLLLKHKKSENILAVLFVLSSIVVFIFDKNQVISFFVSIFGGLSYNFYGVQKLMNYLDYAKNSTEYYSPFKLQSFVAYFFAVVFWFYKDKFGDYEMLCYKAFLFSLVLFVGLSYIPAWQNRFSEIFAFSFVFLIPYTYEFIKHFVSSWLSVTLVSFVCFLLFIKLAFVKGLLVI